jgi:hypothetical protein
VKKELKIKVPGQIKIGCYLLKIIVKPYQKLVHGNWGEANSTIQEIHIDSGLPERAKDNTLIHEIVHMISINYQCGLDEENVERMANGIQELMDCLGIEFDWECSCPSHENSTTFDTTKASRITFYPPDGQMPEIEDN